MFAKFAEFFIKNSKLTIVLIIITLLSGVGSYVIIPKQYNPTIVVPAFQVFVSTPNLASDETKRLVTNELENKIMELEGIDEVYGVSADNYAGVMVKFKVGQDSEKAKIRLYQKMSENMDLKPLGVGDPVIKSINPDDLPQITYAISYETPSNSPLSGGEPNNSSLDKGRLGGVPIMGLVELSIQNQQIYLRQIANLIKQKLKTIPNVTTLDIVGGIKKNIVISIDLDKITSTNTDIMQIYDVLKKNNISLPNGNFDLKTGEKVFLETSGKINDIDGLKKLVISNIAGKILYLGDVADFSYGDKIISNRTKFSTKESLDKNAVLLGIGKQVGTNGVFVTDEVKTQMQEIIKTLPKDVSVEIIQDEGKEAGMATSDLIKDLIESIIIVVVILVLFLGWKNALNTATSVPLILSLVFLYSYIVGYNINRISLFALILVIGMLVDDSIVVVENIVRHLEERFEKGKTKLQAILEATQEVGAGVILSTITKVLSFVGMFAVTGMMGEYMGPIPKFAIAALLFSIIVAFSINPFVSFLTTKDGVKEEHSHKKESKYDIRKIYLKVMKIFISDNNKAKKNRKRFKIIFWISLVLVMILPISLGIFKARMLPKSDKDQVYLWIDSPRGTTVEKSLEIEKDIEKFFLEKKQTQKDLNIVQSITSTIGTAFMGDFANLFRGGLNRNESYQISSRINLIPKEEYPNRMKSENWTFTIRPLLRNYLLEKYPDVKIRLLEDPPGPPVRATFMIKLKGGDEGVNLDNFTKKVYSEVKKLEVSQKLADLGNSLSTTYRKIEIKLDNESIARAGLDSNQVAYSLYIAKNTIPISIINNSNSLEPTNIILGVKNDQSETLNMLDKIRFTSKDGVKIPLSSIAKINYNFVNPEINTDLREKTNFIYAEMGDNSVVYPIVKLMSIFKSKEFLDGKYEVIESGFYGIKYRGLQDGKIYKLEWDGEWKLTMDTFRDLGTAMILALLTIYFLMVGQFRSFAVAGIIMLPFLLGFFGIFPGFSILYLLKNEYFNATGMIGVISLAGIVVGNAILLVDYIDIQKKKGWTIEESIISAGYIRFMPIMLTSISAIFGAIKITSDPVWSGLARSIVWGLSSSAILTLIAIPIFYYDSQKKIWDKCMEKEKIES
ncbi:MAG: efflux RND transporter permease subunit [Candidatus Gracilibacteria bacterium]|nr:efflux RND transporter permease subunit [Candidatus Gracilibacteria bacterium]